MSPTPYVSPTSDLKPERRSEPEPTPARAWSPEPEEIPVDADLAIERIPEPEFPQLPEIKLVVPVIPEIPETPSQNAPEKIPMPDSIFRPSTPEPPIPQPQSVSVETEPDPDETDIEDDDEVIVDERTPADLNRQSAKRDRKTLAIVLSIAVIMAGIVAIALLVVLL